MPYTFDVYNQSGEVVDSVELNDELVYGEINEDVIYQVVVGYLANRRSGTASTKTRSEVKASGRKLYRQKGTGRARAGAASSPTRVHGGVAFGPKPRSYRQKINKKMKHIALRSVLTDELQNDNLTVIDGINIEKPKTKLAQNMLDNLNLSGKLLIVLDSDDPNVYLSTRNIPDVNVTNSELLNAYDVIWHRKVLFTKPAVEKVQERLFPEKEKVHIQEEQKEEKV